MLGWKLIVCYFTIFSICCNRSIHATTRPAPISDRYQNIFDNVAYLEELLIYDWGVHRAPVCIHDIGVFCRAMLLQNSQLWSRENYDATCPTNAPWTPRWYLLFGFCYPAICCPLKNTLSHVCHSLHLQSVIPATPSSISATTHWCCSEQRTACAH